MSERTAEKKVGDDWVPIETKDVKKGDVVRMREADGKLDRMTAKGVLATSDAIFKKGHWGFHANFGWDE